MAKSTIKISGHVRKSGTAVVRISTGSKTVTKTIRPK